MAAADVRADGVGAYLVVVGRDGDVDALAEPGEQGFGERRVRLVVPTATLEGLDLLDEDAPQLVRVVADLLVEDGTWRDLPDEVSLGDLLDERPAVRDRALALL